jgi:hypothetical protein
MGPFVGLDEAGKVGNPIAVFGRCGCCILVHDDEDRALNDKEANRTLAVYGDGGLYHHRDDRECSGCVKENAIRTLEER